MTQEQALNVLVGAVQVGQAKGAYTLQEASIIAQAIELFTPKSQEDKAVEEIKEVVKED